MKVGRGWVQGGCQVGFYPRVLTLRRLFLPSLEPAFSQVLGLCRRFSQWGRSHSFSCFSLALSATNLDLFLSLER